MTQVKFTAGQRLNRLLWDYDVFLPCLDCNDPICSDAGLTGKSVHPKSRGDGEARWNIKVWPKLIAGGGSIKPITHAVCSLAPSALSLWAITVHFSFSLTKSINTANKCVQYVEYKPPLAQGEHPSPCMNMSNAAVTVCISITEKH